MPPRVFASGPKPCGGRGRGNYYEEYEGRNRHNVECFFKSVLYFGWPNQPSSGTTRILHWDVFLCSILLEIRKTS